MLEMRAADTLQHQTGTVLLPVSGQNVTIEAWKPAGSASTSRRRSPASATCCPRTRTATAPMLTATASSPSSTARGGMEYEGGTTTSAGALAHETFHSWYARGIKPASQADGWWDEGLPTFMTTGPTTPLPFDFADPPVLLCSRDPWQRHTRGKRLLRRLALLAGHGVTDGRAHAQRAHGRAVSDPQGRPAVVHAMLEEFLLCSRSGNPAVVDAFHRFVYGLANPSPAPDLWLRDEAGRPRRRPLGRRVLGLARPVDPHADDGGTTHQSPEHGQDNWFHARVRNKFRRRRRAALRRSPSMRAASPAPSSCFLPTSCPASLRKVGVRPGAGRDPHRQGPLAARAGTGRRDAHLPARLGRGPRRRDAAPAVTYGSTTTSRRRTSPSSTSPPTGS